MPAKTEKNRTVPAVAVRSDKGDARWWLGSLAVIKAGGADTGGQLTVIEVTEPAGASAPLHVHHNEDEAFWILDGDARFEVGSQVIEGERGDFLFGPRGVPHRYTAGPRGCRLLFICTPAGFEEVVLATSTPAGAATLPPPEAAAPDKERVASAALAHGIELIDD